MGMKYYGFRCSRKQMSIGFPTMNPYMIPFYVVLFLILISLEENLNLKRDQSLNQRYLVLPKNSVRSAEEIQKDEDTLDQLWEPRMVIKNEMYDRGHYVPQSIKKVGEKQEEPEEKAKKICWRLRS
jgi:hypothetical protein